MFIKIPENSVGAVKRFGKFHRVIDEGLNFFLFPIESVKIIPKEVTISLDITQIITKDNYTCQISGQLQGTVISPQIFASTKQINLCINQDWRMKMRESLGQMTLAEIEFIEKQKYQNDLLEKLRPAMSKYGLHLTTFEIDLQ